MRLALLVASLLLASCALTEAQSPPEDPDAFLDWALSIRVNEAHAAFTTCGSRPITWTSNEVSPADTAMINAHEAEHRTHMREHASCRDWYVWRNTSFENQVNVEARAFCAGARIDFKRGRFQTFVEAIELHSRILATYWFGLDAVRAFLAVASVCPDE